MHAHEQRDDTPAQSAARRVGARPGPDQEPLGPRGLAAQLNLQRLAGNDAVTQALSALESDAGTAVLRSAVHEVLGSSGTPLHPEVRADMEARLGADFSDVRIHTDSIAHASAQALAAHAYTSGSHIAFQRGRYDPSSSVGQRMLAHELTHVIQQRTGTVDGTETADGLKVSDPADRFEHAAEKNAERAMSAEAAPGTATGAAHASNPVGGASVQRVPADNTNDDAATAGAATAGAATAGAATAGAATADAATADAATADAANGDAIEIEYDQVQGANPGLYTDFANHYRVSSASLGEPWVRIEQFCAYMATYWLEHGHSSAGLNFMDLPEETRRDAVMTVIRWASEGGSNAQVTYAVHQLGGTVADLATVQEAIEAGTYGRRTHIWFGNDVHAEAATIRRNGRFLMYDPNTGRTQRRSQAEFLAYIATRNAFVVVAQPPSGSSCCTIM